MSCGKYESQTSTEHAEDVKNHAVLEENNDDETTVFRSRDSSLSNDCGSFLNEHHIFLIRYNYMNILTTLDLNGSRGAKFYCHQCECYFHTRLSMITHMKMHRKPFCPVCFGIFDRELDVHHHIPEFHPDITQHESTPIPLKDEESFKTVDEGHFSQMEAPPNSPNHNDTSELEKMDGSLDLNNNTISFLLAEKLREHQIAIALTADGNPGHQTRDASSHRTNSKQLTSRINKKKSSIGGSSGKVQKGSKAKFASKVIGMAKGQTTVDHEENVLKRITSRFGRSISLKVPQY